MLRNNNKFLLIAPPVSVEDIYGGLAEAGAVSPPLNLLLLAAIIRERGYSPHIIDAPARGWGYERILEEIQLLQPMAVGITAMTPHVLQMAKLCKAVKDCFQHIPVIVGGVHITAVPVATMQRFPCIDIGVIGAAEETLVELLDALAQHADVEKVEGIIFRRNGQLIRTPPRRENLRLDSLPLFAWDLLPGFPDSYPPALFATHRVPATPILTSRGCPGRCIFCFSGCHKTIATHSAGYIFDVLSHLKHTYGIREFMIYDDCFVMYKANLKILLQRIIDSKLDMTWSCNARVDLVDEELLALMARAGCWNIGFGIESGNQGIIDRLQKKITKEHIRDALASAKKCGIRTVGYFMIGHFGETPETIEETIRFAISLPLDEMRMSFFTPLPGTDAIKEASSYGTFDPDAWEEMNLFAPVFIPKGMTRDHLIRKQKEALRRFYFRPRIVWEFLKITRNPRTLLRVSKVLCRYLFDHKKDSPERHETKV